MVENENEEDEDEEDEDEEDEEEEDEDEEDEEEDEEEEDEDEPPPATAQVDQSERSGMVSAVHHTVRAAHMHCRTQPGTAAITSDKWRTAAVVGGT